MRLIGSLSSVEPLLKVCPTNTYSDIPLQPSQVDLFLGAYRFPLQWTFIRGFLCIVLSVSCFVFLVYVFLIKLSVCKIENFLKYGL